ncbi:phosphatase-like protein [Calycina marina]|uniref:protein-tyrosine-phosphatase n=1 Tax=Calycina marina TaxID=1763456 RepID=A0A9P7Z4B0_9HELO|nr:phosphatase-like protein [Calycina marina]
MVTTKTTTTRPTPQRSAHSHSYAQCSRSAITKTSTTPMQSPSATSRVAASVGQPHHPNAIPSLHSPLAGSARTSSPNYFGLQVDPVADPRDSAVGPNGNWSPQTSSIHSFGAASPIHLPIDSNPDFEAFRRQTESNHGFSLGHGNLSHFASTPGIPSPQIDSGRQRNTNGKYSSRKTSPKHAAEQAGADSGLDTAYHSASNRVSNDSPSRGSFFDVPRQESPANYSASPASVQRNVLSHLDDRHPRLSLPHNRADPPSPGRTAPRTSHGRAETLPSTFEGGPAMMSTSQLKEMLDNLKGTHMLLLDLRVSTQYSISRIKNALNLCIPTTLLKRPSYDLQKLEATFSDDDEKAIFAQWKESKCIVVYDAYSSDKKDAVSAINTLKKFSAQGWEGQCCILKGGFTQFSKDYPKYVNNHSTHQMQSSKANLSLGTKKTESTAVAGGCQMPATKNAANPFFSNIRQNQDLIGGVGQQSVQLPDEIKEKSQECLPKWLHDAALKEDEGKVVAGKYLQIELSEQTRMHKALSSGVVYGTPGAKSQDVQIAGIEKGGKNRYNNIWPFEHSRVKLQGRPEGTCDYVNASHIKASRSNKRYIASQGPLPATFEDFWSVVWDQDIRVIVMLTAEQEGGQLKAHPYWSSHDYSFLRLKALKEMKVFLDPGKHRSPIDRRDSGQRRRANTSAETVPPQVSTEEPQYVIVRKFTLAHSSQPFSPLREITQIHYSSWPDFGAPASPGQLLNLVELSNQMQRAASSSTASPRSMEPENDQGVRPMLVHCSAGCGRTGTFCTIDSVIDMLKRQRKDIKSGVTPMDVETSAGGDYIGKGKAPKAGIDGDWIFDQDIDLIERTVEDFRLQRLSMVQSLKQYVLCYETIAEWIARDVIPQSRHGRSDSDGILLRST